MEADRKGLNSLRNGKDGTINCHTARYNSLWWGQRKKNKAKKCPSCLFTLIPRYPSIANHLFFKGYLYMWPEKKGNSLWREEGRKEKKRKRKESLIWTTSASQGSLQQAECLASVFRGKKQCISFLLLCPLRFRPNPGKCKTAAISSVESCMLCPGNPRVQRCKQDSSGRIWEEMGVGGRDTGAKATYPLVPVTYVTGDSSPSQC